jgi:hypothetical protein
MGSRLIADVIALFLTSGLAARTSAWLRFPARSPMTRATSEARALNDNEALKFRFAWGGGNGSLPAPEF